MSGQATSRPLRILVTHMDLLLREVEALEVHEMVAGLLESDEPVRVLATNGRDLFRPRLEDGRAEYDRLRPLWRGRFPRADVVYVHMPFPVVHLAVAVVGRLLGAAVVCSPMSMLSSDFARTSWFRESARWRSVYKRVTVWTLGVMWRRVANVLTCLSEHERVLSRIPRARCALVPWPVPVTELGQEVAAWDAPEEGGKAEPPIAFVSRFDVYRKGIDRLCAWLQEYREVLPRPAVLLLAPGEDEAPPALVPLVEAGVVEWDRETRGAALVHRLETTRAVMLLSRWDGQPRILREAACMGLPTVSTPSSMFDELVTCLGVGAVVDGDDPAAIQAAFELVAGQRGDPRAVRALLDRRAIADYVISVAGAVLRHEEPPRSYYAHAGC